MTHRAVMSMLALSLAACGKDAPPGGPTPEAGGAPVQQCRRYATAYTNVSTSFVGGQPFQYGQSASCLFDRSTATLHCTHTDSDPGCAETRTTTVYASVVDFVEEAAAVGRHRRQRSDRVTSGCLSETAVDVYTYDANKRPLTRRFETSSGSRIASTFAAWDGLGRPTRELSDEGVCVGQVWAITYDDAARTTVSRLLSSGGVRDCTDDYTFTIAYDPDGNIVRMATVNEGAVSWSLASTITATDSVCF